MRIVETLHPNKQFRTFTIDRVISNVRISDISKLTNGCKDADPAVLKLYDQLCDIPLLEDISIDKHEISIKIVDAFEDNEKDWNDIISAVFYCLANFFQVAITEIEAAHFIKDDRKKNQAPTVDIQAIYDIVSKVKISHDFETHRQAWRNAIVVAKEKQEKEDIVNYAELHTGENTYWKNELEKFDAAFDALLALKLPQF